MVAECADHALSQAAFGIALALKYLQHDFFLF